MSNNINIVNNSIPSNAHNSDIGEISSNEHINAIDEIVFDSMPATISVIENVTGKLIKLTVASLKESDKGAFGTVYEGFLKNSQQIAVKKVLQDVRYKNRELQIMKELSHNHITSLLYFYYSSSNKGEQLYLNLVMEFIPQTFSRILKFYFQTKSYLPLDYVKVYIFQLFRGLNYMHQLGFCHRDIKPQNILLDPKKTLLRICDFGSAKKLVSTESNVSYICSRYYRAPELIFGATNYTLAIDVWSAGCVFAEVLLNKPLFHGETSVDQIVEIIKILGTPTFANMMDMNSSYISYKLPSVEPSPFNQIFSNQSIPDEAFYLLKDTFKYSPKDRISALEALGHPFFLSLKEPNYGLKSDRSCPFMFDFNEIELRSADSVLRNTLSAYSQN